MLEESKVIQICRGKTIFDVTPEERAEIDKVRIEELELAKKGQVKVVGVLFDEAGNDEYPTLILECPFCANHEPCLWSDYVETKKEICPSFNKCLKCKEKAAISRTAIFRALADCGGYE